MILRLTVTVLFLACCTFGGDIPPPLHTNASTHVTTPAAAGEVVHLEADIPPNPADRNITLESAELIGAHGVVVIGMIVTYPNPQPNGVCLQAGYGSGFPPAGYRTGDVGGAIIPPWSAAKCGDVPEISIGVRRSDAAAGTIDNVRIHYSLNGHRFVLDLEQSYELHAP